MTNWMDTPEMQLAIEAVHKLPNSFLIPKRVADLIGQHIMLVHKDPQPRGTFINIDKGINWCEV